MSRELDAEVAKAKGLKVKEHWGYAGTVDEGKTMELVIDLGIGVKDIPAYSTDMNAAMELWDEMSDTLSFVDFCCTNLNIEAKDEKPNKMYTCGCPIPAISIAVAHAGTTSLQIAICEAYKAYIAWKANE